MAMKTVYVALLLAAVAAVQGSSIKDMAVDYAQMLAEQLSNGVDEIERLKGSVVDQATKSNQDTLMQLVASAREKVEKEATACKPAAKEEVHHDVSESVTDRFLHCINFTTQITELEKLIYNVSEQVETVESGVCLAITNLTACGSDSGVIEEIHCITSGLLGYINDFSQHSSLIKGFITEFNQQLRKIGSQFLKCFTTVDNDVTTFIKKTVAAKC